MSDDGGITVMNAYNILQTIGQRVKMLRERNHLSQDCFAEMCGLNRSYIGSVERGEHNIGIKNIAAIARGLDIPLHTLFTQQNENTPTQKQPAFRRTDAPKTVAISQRQFYELLRQHGQARPELVKIYLERFGITFT